jgi:hypothetical protein
MGQNEELKAELIIVGDDWERFLSSLERFMTLHQKTLQKLKALGLRNEALRQELRDAIDLSKVKVEPVKETTVQQPVKEPIEVAQAVNQPVEGTLQQDLPVQPTKARPRVLDRLSRIVRSAPLQRSRVESFAGHPLASCEKCGHQIMRAGRFCEGCGGDFGALICPCGRELKAGDKFCDRCGRAV